MKKIKANIDLECPDCKNEIRAGDECYSKKNNIICLSCGDKNKSSKKCESVIGKLLEGIGKTTVVSPLEHTAIMMCVSIEDNIQDWQNKIELEEDKPEPREGIIRLINKRIEQEKVNLKNAETFLKSIQDMENEKNK